MTRGKWAGASTSAKAPADRSLGTEARRAKVAAPAKRKTSSTGEMRALRAERTRALEKASRSQEFLSHASHEIRTPLHGIVGYASLLLGTELTDEQRSLADALRAGVDSLLDVVNDVLDLSRLDAGAMRLESQEFNVIALVQGVARQCGAEAWTKGLDLRVETNGVTQSGVIGDPGRIRQVLVNLVANAVKFTDAGVISIEVSTTARRRKRGSDAQGSCGLCISVSDSGPGVSREARARLFTPFSRLAPAGESRKPGAGLGLAISKQLVELMGGRLTFAAGTKGGSVFTFTVGVREATPSFNRTPRELDAAALRVYVADDDPLSRRELLMALSTEGIGVSGSGTAAEGTRCTRLRARRARGRASRRWVRAGAVFSPTVRCRSGATRLRDRRPLPARGRRSRSRAACQRLPPSAAHRAASRLVPIPRRRCPPSRAP